MVNEIFETAEMGRSVISAKKRKPEEIAELMAFLVSPQAKWMTGSAVRMNGGEIKGV